jgi:hypothetical protein
MFKFQAVLARTQPFFITQRRETGDQSRFKCRQMVRYYAIRSMALRLTSFDQEGETSHSLCLCARPSAPAAKKTVCF